MAIEFVAGAVMLEPTLAANANIPSCKVIQYFEGRDQFFGLPASSTCKGHGWFWFRSATAGNQLRSDLRRTRLGATFDRRDGLGFVASELQTTAASYGSTIGELSSSWPGPSSEAAASAAAPYTEWLSNTATQAEQTASQAQAAAAAYEAAFAASVPQPVIEANRALLAALVATNFFGQNTPAIAATEATYAEFWAQDAGAMYGYAGAATTAGQLTPFTAAPATTNDTGQATQSAATANSAAASTADSTTDGIEAFLTQLNTEITQFGTQLGSLNTEIASLPPASRTDGIATVGHERHHGYRESDYHLHQHRQHLRLWAVVIGRTRRLGEELVPGLHQYPEPLSASKVSVRCSTPSPSSEHCRRCCTAAC